MNSFVANDLSLSFQSKNENFGKISTHHHELDSIPIFKDAAG